MRGGTKARVKAGKREIADRREVSETGRGKTRELKGVY